MANDETLQSCNTAKLNLSTMKEQARKSHVFGDLNNNLLSVGQLCDSGYDVKFDKHKATVQTTLISSSLQNVTTQMGCGNPH
jgi:hypothetical protein